ncbi:MAG: hypothetical protein D6776_09655 [Planctomycetota bacterium]|nr:MAG: hypothetical protein D6776_09655 [Planctomycetota bacterium]
MRLKPQQIPQELALGLAWRMPRITLGAEFTWIDWSSTFDRFEARLEDGTSAELNELTGDGNTTVHVSVPLRWRDQIVIAFGASVAVTDALVLRAGYNYGRNPVPSRFAEPTLPAIFEHHVTAGCSLSVRRLEISAAIEYALPVSFTIDRNDANLEVSGSRIDASLLWVSLGVGLRF